MLSSTVWAEQLRIFPHVHRGVCVSYACFNPNLLVPCLSLSWALLVELLYQLQHYLPAKFLYSGFFLIQPVKKKGGTIENFWADSNIQIHHTWRSLKVGGK